ncbi:hypothetical protein A5790_14580 [Mycobacterium sp. 852002-51152_SCH6134967]|uniref:type II toxin-antitoxin system death-on-curing family toxin n=1 Tax=Mycobacterium sp. 852002-51152_SCH6134967 TaxID=1834096 RepID=UPI0008003AF0|nr:Fic family protein [Mycobacterium sp. 852002-51152_SCH6134967]OBF92365.1 hypothetical protein A5790_14580 [Mycobacterium sp. 852002-51152_SCH6134967]
MIIRLTCEAVIAINESVTGPDHGLDSRDLLESAVGEPFQTWGGDDFHPTLVEKAAVLLRGIASNHPFRDGNKRTSWLSCVNFLALNESPLDRAKIDPILAGHMVLNVVKGEISYQDVAVWLAEHLQ